MPAKLLDRARCEEIFAELMKHSDADESEMLITGGTHELTRFANNTIHQNVAEEGYVLSFRAVYGQRTARATTNRFDPESLRRLVRQSANLARQQPDDPELLPLPGPQQYRPVDRFVDATAAATPLDRARGVASAIRTAEQHNQTAAGTLSTGMSMEALLNSRGLNAYYRETQAEFSITTMAPSSTGWTKKNSPDISQIDAEALAARAAGIAERSRDPREIPPGRYTAILEPAAVLDLVGFMFYDFSGQALRDQRSFLNDRIGAELFGKNIHVADDVCHPLQSGAPFDGEGIPRQSIPLIEGGVIQGLTYSRQSARALDAEPTGHGLPLPNEYGEFPVNIVFAGGPHSVEEMIASTERGILVTRLWYIREVDSYRKILTGMTRDGTFLVEDGKVRCGIRNFRFNENLIDLLNSVEMLGPAILASGEESFPMVVPAMKVSPFHFTETTRF